MFLSPLAAAAAAHTAAMSFTWEQIAAHNSASDCWIVIDDHVYDVAEFLDEHPGGEEVCCARDEDEGETPRASIAASRPRVARAATLAWLRLARD